MGVTGRAKEVLGGSKKIENRHKKIQEVRGLGARKT